MVDYSNPGKYAELKDNNENEQSVNSSNENQNYFDDYDINQEILEFNAEIPWRKSLFQIMRDGIKISSNYVSSSLLFTINLHFIGLLGRVDYVSAVGLANTCINFTSMHLVWGFNNAFQNFATKAFGSKNYPLFNKLKVKGLVVIVCVLIISLIITLFIKNILVPLGIEDDISEIIGKYMLYTFPAIVFMALYDFQVEILNSQESFNCQMFIQTIAPFSHILWCYIYVVVMDLEVLGISLAVNSTQLLNFLILSFCRYYFKLDKTISEPIELKECLTKDWKVYLQEGFPLAFSLIFEYFAMEGTAIISGNIKPLGYVAAHMIYISIINVLYNLGDGYASAIYSYVGISIGRRHIINSMKWAILGMISLYSIVFITIFLLLILKNQWIYLFIDDESVANILIDLLPYFCVCAIAICSYQGLGSILKIIGKQKTVLMINIVGFYGLMIPLSYILAITYDFKIRGIWISMCLAYSLVVSCYIVLLYRLDWENDVTEALSTIESIDTDFESINLID